MLQLIKSDTTLNAAALLRDYAAFNQWATQRLIKWLKSKPAHIIEAKTESSFYSLRNTLLHIWATEAHWFSWMVAGRECVNIQQTFDGTLEELYDGVLEQAEVLSEYVESLDEETLAEPCNFTESHGMTPARPRAEMLMHTMHHSMYHRGQLTSMGHQVGLHDAPMTDYMFYILMGRR
ncbi:DinB family protein [uncultured Chitinophaga sp.]|uniref:DinB family protein n=1 Tax=uncultured Chitinophaga sp. TaxID=339340 RepID=UPI0025F65273|nr:DinB family protein [uncultured Chitinophaga sp.]